MTAKSIGSICQVALKSEDKVYFNKHDSKVNNYFEIDNLQI